MRFFGVPRECPILKDLNVNKIADDDILWYAMRVTYSRELSLKAYLDEIQVESFIPMHYEYVVKNERKTRKLVPAVHNLIFIHTSRKKLDEIKETKAATSSLRYIMDRGTRQPITIPEQQMRNFIAVAGTYDQQIVYLPPMDVTTMSKGDRVRITGGIFEGVEGVFVRIKGDRRVVVSIQGIMAVATTFIHPSLIEKIDN